MGKGHDYGTLESVKFQDRRQDYYKYIEYIKELEISSEDYLEHFTAYVGHMALNRVLALYELYKKTLGIAGHVAEVGVYKGAGTILFAKLIRLYENESLTQVHGFDWFKGTGKGGASDSKLVHEGGYLSDYDSLIKLIRMQKLDHIIRIHNFDVRKKLKSFFNKYIHLQFKMVFLDAGMYDVMKVCIPIFWDRVIPGGIMVFDQFNHELAPGETKALKESLPKVKVQTIPNSWMPNAFIVKE